MALLGANNPVTANNDSTVGTADFVNPINALASDNVYATAPLTLNQVTRYLKTSFNFFVPLDATITGILLEVERSVTGVGAAIQDNSVKLVKNNIISSVEMALAGNWPTSDAYASYGSATNLWGMTLNPVELANIGAVISAKCTVAGTARIDHMRMTVYYIGSNRPSMLSARVKVGNGMGVAA